MPQYTDPRKLLEDLLLWLEAIRSIWPSFENRMANKERRVRLRHQRRKISDEELAIELKAIEQKRAAKASR